MPKLQTIWTLRSPFRISKLSGHLMRGIERALIRKRNASILKRPKRTRNS
jgi:hypothetical protein